MAKKLTGAVDRANRRPPPLAKGDLVALITPAGPVETETLEGAARMLEDVGLRVNLRSDAGARQGYLAGEDERRLSELTEALLDKEVKAVFTARGGYGTQRILPRLKLPEELPAKHVIGFSDNTALLSYLYRRYGWAVLHGAHPRPGHPNELAEVLRCLGLGGRATVPSFGGLRLINEDSLNPEECVPVTASVVGGCLSILSTSVGTPFAPPLKGKILFLEDVAEPVYRLDRMLHHLLWSGELKDVRAIVFGEPDTFVPEWAERGEAEEMLAQFASELEIPVMAGLPCGHVDANRPLPLGLKATLNPVAGLLEFTEALTK
jgi:muramoyltetrapeptide carboxypeptidase